MVHIILMSFVLNISFHGILFGISFLSSDFQSKTTKKIKPIVLKEEYHLN